MTQNLLRTLVLAVLTAGLTTTALAQPQDAQWTEPETPAADTYPVNYTQRPIVLPALVARGDLNLSILRFNFMGFSDTAVRLDIGGAFGIIDNLEAGISGERIGLRRLGGLLPLSLSPDFDFLDPYVYGRYRFVASDAFEMAGELGLVIPFNGNFGFVAALPLRVRAGEIFSLDGGVEFEGIFVDIGVETNFQPNLHIVLQPRIAPIENIFFGLNTGVSIIDFDGDLTVIPLGFTGGYVLDIAPTRIDLFAEFNFPGFIQPGSAGDTVVTEIYVFTLGARAFLDFN